MSGVCLSLKTQVSSHIGTLYCCGLLGNCACWVRLWCEPCDGSVGSSHTSPPREGDRGKEHLAVRVAAPSPARLSLCYGLSGAPGGGPQSLCFGKQAEEKEENRSESINAQTEHFYTVHIFIQHRQVVKKSKRFLGQNRVGACV